MMKVNVEGTTYRVGFEHLKCPVTASEQEEMKYQMRMNKLIESQLVRSRGELSGATICTIQRDDEVGKLWQGRAFCWSGEAFVKATGRKVALERAVSDFSIDYAVQNGSTTAEDVNQIARRIRGVVWAEYWHATQSKSSQQSVTTSNTASPAATC